MRKEKVNKNQMKERNKMKEANLNDNNNNNNEVTMKVNEEVMNQVVEVMKEQSEQPVTIEDDVVEPIITTEQWERFSNDIPISVKRSWRITQISGFMKVSDFLRWEGIFFKSVGKLPCLCGSGKKFKKCCQKPMQQFSRVWNRIECTHISKDVPKVTHSEKVPYRISWKNLPSPYYEIVKKYVDEHPIVESSCWFVSHHIATLHPDFKISNGYYGSRIHDVHLGGYKKNMKKYNTNYLGEKIWDVGLRGTKSRLCYDDTLKSSWMPHSWNVIEGAGKNGGDLVFDLVGEFFDMVWARKYQFLTEQKDEAESNGATYGGDEKFLREQIAKCLWTYYREFERLDMKAYERSGWDTEMINWACNETIFDFYNKDKKANNNPLWNGVDKTRFEERNTTDLDGVLRIWELDNYREVLS